MNPIEKRTGFFKSFDNTEIYYELRGRGKPLIFLYGLSCSTNHWRHQIRFFSRNYQVITFDYRGHHKSSTPENRDNLNVESIAKDVEALCKHLNLQRAAMIGHSFGSIVLLELYKNRPELFESLVFINGFARNPIRNIFGMDIIENLIHFAKKGTSELPETYKFLWKSILGNPISSQIVALSGGFNINLTSFKDVQVYMRGVRSVELEVFLGLFEKMMEYNGMSILNDVEVPTLLIGGSQDYVTPIEFQTEMQHRIKKSKLQVIPYGSHCSQLDMPDLVNLRMERFFQRNSY